MIKKITGFILIIVLCFTCVNPVLAETSGEEVNVSKNIEDVLDEYHENIRTMNIERNNNPYLRTIKSEDEIKKDTIKELQSLGYEAYDVNSNTFDEVEKTLHTDFEQINLNEEYSYIIVISGEDPVSTTTVKQRSSYTSSFTYTSNGKTYTMRYMTVTAADDPAYGKATTVDLLSSKTQSVIENCLDTIIYACVSSVSKTLGTVASICGLSVSNFGTSNKSTLNLNGATNWTRIFTQVYDSVYDDWTNGSCVEYAKASSYLSGQYYSASENRYISVPTDESWVRINSDEFSNATWRKENAVYGYTYSWTQYDLTGKVQYKYGDKVKITHKENF